MTQPERAALKARVEERVKDWKRRPAIEVDEGGEIHLTYSFRFQIQTTEEFLWDAPADFVDDKLKASLLKMAERLAEL